jgi:hypothetical protein
MASAPSSNGQFRVPPDGHLYYEGIVERCHGFINCHIWEGLDKNLLRAWLTNFRTDEEKYFAACVLDALIFRSEKQTISLLRHLFLRVLPDLARVTIRDLCRRSSHANFRLVSQVPFGVRS